MSKHTVTTAEPLGAGPGCPNTRTGAPDFELSDERYQWLAEMSHDSRAYWLRTFLCEHDHGTRLIPVPGIADRLWQQRWEREATFHMPRAWKAWERAQAKFGKAAA